MSPGFTMQALANLTLFRIFLGNTAHWYKLAIIAFLIINPLLLYSCGTFITGWVIILEFIFTLAMALKCYPLQAGGLLALEAVLLNLTTPAAVYLETKSNFQVILLLVFMVAGIYFLKNLLMVTFTRILLGIRSKITLSLMFMLASAVLSAFLDALTVTAVIISVGIGFYSVYHKVASGKSIHHDNHDHNSDHEVVELHKQELNLFRSFLRDLLMHAAIGTALGGVCTLVGEPQNLLIADKAGWAFMEFFYRMLPVTLPVFISGIVTCFILETQQWFGYGVKLPEKVRAVLSDFAEHEKAKMTNKDRMILQIQIIVAILLVMALAFHLAEVGLIGLCVIVLVTAFTGITEEHAIGKAFEEALPFTALLVVFFVIVSMIHDQELFTPIINQVLQTKGQKQLAMFYLANGLLSMISDNVFVATVYINEAVTALQQGIISREQFDLIAVAINTGTNLPSVATPNGQAAFLFLLTSSIAPLVRLSYGCMVWMALPYTIVMTIIGLIAVMFFL